jgi:hypothetical protein
LQRFTDLSHSIAAVPNPQIAELPILAIPTMPNSAISNFVPPQQYVAAGSFRV